MLDDGVSRGAKTAPTAHIRCIMCGLIGGTDVQLCALGRRKDGTQVD